MVFYEPGVTTHGLPREPFKVRLNQDVFKIKFSKSNLVMRGTSADRMDIDQIHRWQR